MALLTALAMILWTVLSGGSRTTESLKWLQFLQTIATFLLPSILGAWLWSEDHKPFTWLRLTKTTHWTHYLLAIGIMLCAMPGINLLADLNSRVALPESLDFIEQILKQQEAAAAALTERFLQADNIGVLLINIGLMAFLPALAEEISFRGTLQQIISPITNHKYTLLFGYHAYFDLFSGLIQTTVFISLSAIFIGQEVPEELQINTLVERRE